MKRKKQKKVLRFDEGGERVKQIPRTVENSRPIDETMLEADDEQTKLDVDNDEFAKHWDPSKENKNKILITSSDNPHTRTIKLCRDLKAIIPKAEFRYRNRSAIKKVIRGCIDRNYSHLIVISENRREPNSMLITHLPNGPTAKFRLSSVNLTDHRLPCSEVPELILNNFNTRLGYTVGRMLASLFPTRPKFARRTVCTFHNQRDFIFFRYHRYEVDEAKGNVSLRECGPQMTLKLLSLQSGLFDPHGEYEWALKRHEMQKDRKKFYMG